MPARRRHVLVIALLVAATPLAGCLDAAGASIDRARASVGMPADEISAKSALRAADEEAEAWDPDARLEEMAAVERTKDMAYVQDEHDENESRIPADPDVGNGRAPAWSFEYVSLNAELSFTVNADFTITDRETEDEDDAAEEHAEMGRMPEWDLDSDKAVRMLKDNGTWQAYMEGREPAMVVNALEEEDGARAWVFVFMDDNWTGAGGIVDARTGDVKAVWQWPMNMGEGWNWGWNWNASEDWGGKWSWNGGRGGNVTYQNVYEGELTALDDPDVYEFPVESEGQWIEVKLESRGYWGVRPEGFDVRVLDADGNRVPLERRGAHHGDEGLQVGHASGPGTYTLEIELDDNTLRGEYEATLRVGDAPYPGMMGFGWS